MAGYFCGILGAQEHATNSCEGFRVASKPTDGVVAGRLGQHAIKRYAAMSRSKPI